jgi:DNA replication protein DnaC
MSLIKQLMAIPDEPSDDGEASSLVAWSATPIYEWRTRAEAERKTRRPHLLSDRMGWPKRAVLGALTADETKPCIRAVAEWQRSESHCLLVLSGQKGAGKTVAAAWWALRQTGAVEFVTAEKFVTSSSFDGARDRWVNAAALVLDDLGVEYQDVKGASASALDALVNEFYSHGRPLVMTTNLGRDEFKARVGERIADRIRECSGWREFANAPSLRGGR